MEIVIGSVVVVFIFLFMALFSWLFSPGTQTWFSADRVDRFIYQAKGLEAIVRKTIDEKHPFYTALSNSQRKEFLWRVYYFKSTTEFIIKFQGNPSEIASTIAFTAAQVSLGLPIQSYTQYEKVIVYEDDYLSTHSRQYHKGEVHPGVGAIVFSWHSILFGLSDHYDGINVLVHEFAHALRLEHKMRLEQYEVFDDDDLTEFDKEATKALDVIRATDDHFFRKYATTNIEEFFAVASENFFERPRELNDNFPKLYDALKKLYKQDLLNLMRLNP